MNEDKENLRREVSLLRAEAIFKDVLSGSSVKLTDPSRIHEELANLKDLSAKLKFQYLEQETRDKFLRYMLLDHERNVSQEEVKQITAENEESKARLKETKAYLQVLLNESEVVSDEVIELNREFEKRQADMDVVMLEANQLQEDLDQLENESENADFKTLLELSKLENSDNVAIESIFKLAQNAVAVEATAVNEARNLVSTRQAEHKKNLEIQTQLEAQLNNIFGQIQTAEQSQDKPATDTAQLYAQTLLEANVVLQRFVGTDFELTEKDENFKLKIRSSVIVLDKHMNILLLKEVSNKAIEIINCANVDKFWRLLRVISHLIYD